MITVETHVNAPLETVWASWNQPEHIQNWCQASPDWHAPHAENDLRVGGNFKTVMAAKDGSFSFDFGGVYDVVVMHERIAYTMADGRKAIITFSEKEGGVAIVESFDPETQNPEEMQQQGWQAILNSFKAYTESL